MKKIVKRTGRAIAWKGRDGKYRVLEYPYDKSKMTIHSKQPQGATVVDGAASAFKFAERLYGRVPSKVAMIQARADNINEMRKMGVTTDMAPVISEKPIQMSAKPPRISE